MTEDTIVANYMRLPDVDGNLAALWAGKILLGRSLERKPTQKVLLGLAVEPIEVGPGIVMLDDCSRRMAGPGPGNRPALAQPDAVTKPRAFEDELGAVTPHGEAGAADRASPEARGDDGT